MNPWRRLTEIRFPDDLPVVCGFLSAVLVSATLLAPVIAESALGRPSSTAGIGYFVVPMLGLLSGAAAFLIARGLRWIARRHHQARVRELKRRCSSPCTRMPLCHRR